MSAFETTQIPEATPTPGPVLYELVTPAPLYEDTKSMSGLEITIFATAIAVGIILMCLLLTIGKRMG